MVSYLLFKKISETHILDLILVFGNMEVEYSIHFNTIPKVKVLEDNDDDLAEGPIVSRTCLKCGNKKMRNNSYI